MTLGRAERMKNMTGVFEANAQLFSDTLYIVIDDVVTTGSTLAAARTALLQTGAQRIFLLALAH
jgi:predicted amidophosphoribosyltransferase